MEDDTEHDLPEANSANARSNDASSLATAISAGSLDDGSPLLTDARMASLARLRHQVAAERIVLQAASESRQHRRAAVPAQSHR